MPIGEVIRKYRKEKNMTQEDMAERLGVTAPAVNKWEKGNSYPDIMLLAPIARLLDISLDTLLSFQAELTEEQINGILLELDQKLDTEPYRETFTWITNKIETYPNCDRLLLHSTIMLDARRLLYDTEKDEDANRSLQSGGETKNRDEIQAEYDAFILKNYRKALESEDAAIRDLAADSLFGWYLRKDDYEKAEECLSYFSASYPDQERKKAVVCRKTGRRDEAYKILEGILFRNYTENSSLFHELYSMALEENDTARATAMVEKQRSLTRVFEMGKYREASAGLELAVCRKDAEETIRIAGELLENVENLYCFTESDLYRHMVFKEPKEGFFENLKENLKKNFREDAALVFLKDDERWKMLVGIS